MRAEGTEAEISLVQANSFPIYKGTSHTQHQFPSAIASIFESHEI